MRTYLVSMVCDSLTMGVPICCPRFVNMVELVKFVHRLGKTSPLDDIIDAALLTNCPYILTNVW